MRLRSQLLLAALVAPGMTAEADLKSYADHGGFDAAGPGLPVEDFLGARPAIGRMVGNPMPLAFLEGDIPKAPGERALPDAGGEDRPPVAGSIFRVRGDRILVAGEFRVSQEVAKKGAFKATSLKRLPGGAADEVEVRLRAIIRIEGEVTKPIATPAASSKGWVAHGVTFEIAPGLKVTFAGYAHVVEGQVKVEMTPAKMADAALATAGHGLELRGEGVKGDKFLVSLGREASLVVIDPNTPSPLHEGAGDEGVDAFVEAFKKSQDVQRRRVAALIEELRGVARDRPILAFGDDLEKFLARNRVYEVYQHAETVLANSINLKTPNEKARITAAQVLLGQVQFEQGVRNAREALVLMKNQNSVEDLRKHGLPKGGLFPGQVKAWREVDSMLNSTGNARTQSQQQQIAAAVQRVVNKIKDYEGEVASWNARLNKVATALTVVGKSKSQVRGIMNAASKRPAAGAGRGDSGPKQGEEKP